MPVAEAEPGTSTLLSMVNVVPADALKRTIKELIRADGLTPEQTDVLQTVLGHAVRAYVWPEPNRSPTK